MSQHTGVSSVCLPWDGGGSGDRRLLLSWAAVEEEGLNLTQQLWELAPESCVLTSPHKLTHTPTTHVDKSYLCVHLCACVCACVCFLSPKGNERWNSRTLKQSCLFSWSSIKCLTLTSWGKVIFRTLQFSSSLTCLHLYPSERGTEMGEDTSKI